MMKTRFGIVIFYFSLLTFALFAHFANAQVPADREDLLNGKGIGDGVVAESNGYPGPMHVIDLADKLKLTDAQRKSVQEVQKSMKTRARELGQRIVGIEEELNEAFSSGLVSEKSMREDCDQIARLRGRLRAVHLAAHLKTKELLTEQQIDLYKKLKGAEKSDDTKQSRQKH